MPRVAAIVLAAGGSLRMGRPKQLLSIGRRSLLVRTVEVALRAGCRPVVVVLGRDSKACTADLLRWHRKRFPTRPRFDIEISATRTPYRPLPGRRDGRVLLVRNDAWERGMGTSLRAGMRALGPAAGAYLLLCDQPGVTPDVLLRLRHAQRTSHREICVAAYAGTVGPPVLVRGDGLRRLRDWPEDHGAKALWKAQPERVTQVACPEAADDVDTPEDFARWTTILDAGR